MVFSDLKKMELVDILKILKNVTIEYRYFLDSTIPDFTFGTEIEFEQYNYQKLWPHFFNKNLKNWKTVYERSIKDGGEVVSRILYNRTSDWEELREICSILKEQKVTIGDKSGGHIHVGAQIFEGNIEYWLELLKIWTVFEPILCQFGYGEKGYARTMMWEEAQPFNNELKQTINKLKNNKDLSELICLLKDYKRSRVINFRNTSWNKSDKFEYKNTIEFRLFNSSVSEVIWQNNINMLLNLFSAIKNNNYDKEWINYHFDKDDSTNDLDMAISFADMIYTSEIDKLYFLKQYLQQEYIEEEKKCVKTI